MIDGALTVEDVVRLLDLARHPEGGFYRETWRDRPEGGGRGSGTGQRCRIRPGRSLMT